MFLKKRWARRLFLIPLFVPILAGATENNGDSTQSCQLYGVHDEQQSDSQFFSVSNSGVNLLGSLQAGKDIEALTIHPETSQLFAASGKQGEKQGHLYLADTVTGALSEIGATGYQDINGIAFNPLDSTLWGWAVGDGLIEINPATAESRLHIPYEGDVEDIVWDTTGETLYAVADNVFYSYTPLTETVQTVDCAVESGEIEAIEVLPNSSSQELLYTTHNDSGLSVYKLNVQTCESSKLNISLATDSIELNDIEGISVSTTICGNSTELSFLDDVSQNNPSNSGSENDSASNDGDNHTGGVNIDEPFVLTVNDDTETYGLTLTIPAGAHPDPSSLSVKVIDDTETRLTPVYKFEPEGTRFFEPVTVTIKYNPNALAGFSANDQGFSEEDISFLHNGSGIATVVDTENNTLTAQLMHFSTGQGGITQSCESETKLTNQIFSDVQLKDFYANSARKLCRMGIIHGKEQDDGSRIIDPWTKTNVIEVLKVLLSVNGNRYSGESEPEVTNAIRRDAEELLGTISLSNGSAVERGLVIEWIAKIFYENISKSDAIEEMVEAGITNGRRMFASDINPILNASCFSNDKVIDNQGGFDSEENKTGDGIADCVQVNRAELITLAYRLINLNRTVNPYGGNMFADGEKRKNGFRDRETVVLLLHGLNSSAGTWNDLVLNDTTFNNHCPSISVNTQGIIQPFHGEINIAVDRSQDYEGVFCYRLNFGAFDSIANQVQGLENIECLASNGRCRGDWSTFEQLGHEVKGAVTFIKDRHGHETQIVLLGHSRGGLAARAFLQSDVPIRKDDKGNAIETRSVRDNVVSLITTGTPHRGSPFGRVYNYLEDNCITMENGENTSRNAWFGSNCESDWEVANTVLNNGELDIRRPSVGYLSDESHNITDLNSNISNLPTIDYSTLVYDGAEFGILGRIDVDFLNNYIGTSTSNADRGYSVFDRDGGDLGDQLSKGDDSAQEAILGEAHNRGNPPDTHLGDGIVPADRQQLGNINGWSFSLDTRLHNNGRVSRNDGNLYNGVLHTEEPEQRADLIDALDALYERLTEIAQRVLIAKTSP